MRKKSIETAQFRYFQFIRFHSSLQCDRYNSSYTKTKSDPFTFVERTRCWENTVLFLVSCFQYLILGVVYSKGKPYRQPTYTNGMYRHSFSPSHLIFFSNDQFSLLLRRLMLLGMYMFVAVFIVADNFCCSVPIRWLNTNANKLLLLLSSFKFDLEAKTWLITINQLSHSWNKTIFQNNLQAYWSYSLLH